MSTEISTFGFHGSNVRAATDGNAVWFCGRDICEQLEYRNSNDAIKQHCRGVAKRYPIVDALGRTQEAVFIPEPDVWRLICSSQQPRAVELERWIFEEVIPALRRTGRYDVGWRERVSSVTPPSDSEVFFWKFLVFWKILGLNL